MRGVKPINILEMALTRWKINTEITFCLLPLKSCTHCPRCVCCCTSLSLRGADHSHQHPSQNSFALLTMKIPGAGADAVSQVQCKHSK